LIEIRSPADLREAVRAVPAAKRQQKIPLVAPILIGKPSPPTPEKCTTQLFYKYYNNGQQQFCGPV
jgi:hypothetical protein